MHIGPVSRQLLLPVWVPFPLFHPPPLPPNTRTRAHTSFTVSPWPGWRAPTCCSHVPRVRVPKIKWEATSRRVLTMEWIDGVKLTDEKGELERLMLR